MTHGRLGEVLVENGVLSSRQVQNVLEVQRDTGEPFGLIAEKLFGIAPAVIEEAWATQYARLTRTTDPATETYDERTRELVTRRQAWQFRVLPIRFDGPDLMLATTPRHLRRALRFATNVMGIPVYLVLADPKSLGEALVKRYPLPGMTAAALDDDFMDFVLNSGEAA